MILGQRKICHRICQSFLTQSHCWHFYLTHSMCRCRSGCFCWFRVSGWLTLASQLLGRVSLPRWVSVLSSLGPAQRLFTTTKISMIKPQRSITYIYLWTQQIKSLRSLQVPSQTSTHRYEVALLVPHTSVLTTIGSSMTVFSVDSSAIASSWGSCCCSATLLARFCSLLILIQPIWSTIKSWRTPPSLP